jgi:hypothetical protein
VDFKDFELGDIQNSSSSGLDAFLDDTPTVTASAGNSKRYRVASVEALTGFRRIASDTLIRKSERDLWSLSQTDEGDWVIERLFDDDGNPLKA